MNAMPELLTIELSEKFLGSMLPASAAGEAATGVAARRTR
jgi:hypothetical protein